MEPATPEGEPRSRACAAPANNPAQETLSLRFELRLNVVAR